MNQDFDFKTSTSLADLLEASFEELKHLLKHGVDNEPVIFDQSIWIRIATADEPCAVCLAGAVLLKTLPRADWAQISRKGLRGRGPLVDRAAAIDSLRTGHLGVAYKLVNAVSEGPGQDIEEEFRSQFGLLGDDILEGNTETIEEAIRFLRKHNL